MKPAPLWDHWPALQRKIASAESLALFLDYDGTLVPIARHPSKARLPAQVKALLGRIARLPGVWTALVSGRRLSEIKGLVGLQGLCYVGNHGLELQGLGLRYVNPVARASRPLLKKVAARLRAALKPVHGAWVEDKGLTLSVHHRAVAEKNVVLVKNRFYEILRPHLEKRELQATAGRRVFEARPPVRWTKGTVVEWLLARRAAAGSGKPFPIFVGDDETDEDAFEILRERGLTVTVGPSNPLTLAEYFAESPREVRRFLRGLLKARGGA